MSSKSKKKPLIKRVTIYLDDEPIEQLEAARTELADAEREADARYAQRLSLVRAVNPSGEELLKTEAGLDGERQKSLEPLRAAVTAAEEAVREASETYVFRSPGYRAYEDLLAAHPPTDEDHDRARKVTGRAEALSMWNDETFPPALVALCCAEPGLTVDEAREIRDEWTDDEFGELFDAAIHVSRNRRQVDLGKALRAVSKPA